MTRYKIIISPTSGRDNDYCCVVKLPLGLLEACQVLADDQRQIMDGGGLVHRISSHLIPSECNV